MRNQSLLVEHFAVPRDLCEYYKEHFGPTYMVLPADAPRISSSSSGCISAAGRQEGNDVTGGTAAIFHAGTAPRQRYQGLIRRDIRVHPLPAQTPDELVRCCSAMRNNWRH